MAFSKKVEGLKDAYKLFAYADDVAIVCTSVHASVIANHFVDAAKLFDLRVNAKKCGTN